MQTGANNNKKPVIAILAQGAKPDLKKSYIPASYVKFIEASGALVVPVPSSLSEDEVNKIYDCVNGVLFPGGSIKLSNSAYFRNIKLAIKKCIYRKDKQNDCFPLWGTCLGFQALHRAISEKDHEIIQALPCQNTNLHLEFTDEARDSRLLRDIPEKLYKAYERDKITFNQHKYGVSPSAYDEEKKLREFFRIISMNEGTGGRFISTVEARNYPIYAVQWHPEKNCFENFVEYDINQSPIAVEASQYMGNFFVNEARKSQQCFPTREDLYKHLIFNWNPLYTGNGHEYMRVFEQTYYFD